MLRGLFVAATVAMEAAHETAIAGQSAGHTAHCYADLARRLQETAGQIAALSDAIQVIADQAADTGSNASEPAS